MSVLGIRQVPCWSPAGHLSEGERGVGKRAGSSPEPLAFLALKEKVSRAHTLPLSDPFILQATVLVLRVFLFFDGGKWCGGKRAG